MAKKINYTTPVIYPKDRNMDKEWYVFVRYYIPETKTWKSKFYKEGINRYHKPEERLREAEALCSSIKKGLAGEDRKPEPEIIYTFSTGLDYALSLCNISETTRRNYRCTVKHVKEAAEVIRLHNKPVSEIKRKQVKQILEQCRKARKWSDKAYNKNLGYLKAVLSILVEWEEIEYNPAHKIRTLEVEETQKFVPYTVEEKKKIREYLYLHNYKFFVYFMVIYHTGMRPFEVLALKIKDIDFIRRLIILMPDKQRKNSKTKKRREVPINDHLYLFLREHLEGYTDPELFVFGSPFESGKGNRGTGSPSDMFKPSYTRIKRDTVTRLWETLIIIGLGINKYLYAAKHTGADDKIMAGINIEALKEMYGHSSTQMTEKYITALKGIHQKQIIELSPDF